MTEALGQAKNPQAPVPVVHYFSGLFGSDARSLPNARLARFSPEWTRWLYRTEAATAQLWFDLGRTRAFVEHVDATRALNKSACPSLVPSRCRWLYPEVAAAARRAGLDSIQFTRHTMDRFRPKPRYEIVDLSPWRDWRRLGALGPPYYASGSRAACARLVHNHTTLRVECHSQVK
jgi:hypothetical protein